MFSFRESISAFGPHKHKIAVSTASAAALACAVFGTTMGQTPDARAAAGSATVKAAAAQRVRIPQIPVAPVKAAAPASPSASPSTVSPHVAAPEPVVKTTAAAPAAAPTTAPVTAAPVTHTAAADPYAGLCAYQVAERIVPSGQFAAFAWIITRESGWSVTATNPSSGAYGLGQALPATKMAPYGSDYLTNPVTQIKWALAYMNGRYGSPNAAQVWWENHGWY